MIQCREGMGEVECVSKEVERERERCHWGGKWRGEVEKDKVLTYF